MIDYHVWDQMLQQRRKELEHEADVARLMRRLKSEAKQARHTADTRRPSLIDRVVRYFHHRGTRVKPLSNHIAGRT
jgi:hypothetical protein